MTEEFLQEDMINPEEEYDIIKTAYIYDSQTKEFLRDILVQENPKHIGEYLMPPCSTLLQPPLEEGKIACFIDEEWILKIDYRGHYQVKLEDVTFSIVDYIGEAQEGYQFISDEVYEDYQSDNDKYKVVDGVFIDISNTQEYIDIKTAERRAEFENKFLALDTNKNYRLQPRGYANAQQSIDTVNNMVNALGGLTTDIASMVLFYETPDFSKPEECTEEWLIQHQFPAQPMTIQEWATFYVDFTTKYAHKMYQQLARIN